MIPKIELVSAFTEEIKMDPQRKVNSEALIVNNLNAAQYKVQSDANFGLPDQMEVLTFTGAPYTLPPDFIGVADPDSVKAGESLIGAVDYNDIIGRNDVTQTGKASSYYIRKVGGDYIFGTYPVDGTSTFTLPYKRQLPRISDVQDCILPLEFKEPIVYYAVYLTLKRLRGYEAKAQEFYQYYQESVGQLMAGNLMSSRHAMKFGSPRGRTRQYKWF